MGNGQKSNQKGLHPRNLHSGQYDFAALTESYVALQPHVQVNEHEVESIDFTNPRGVKALNTALLKHYYHIYDWDIPDGYLCPPIPGRVDYIHHIADLLGATSPDDQVRMLDIGTGANGIYSLLASQTYEWRCTASDIELTSLENVAKILQSNPALADRLTLRHQYDNSHIFSGIILEGETYDVSVCNPPFHASAEEATKENRKKVKNLHKNREKNSRVMAPPLTTTPTLNFGGQNSELWCKGGEIRFLRKMTKESKKFSQQCKWFTSLISKSENVKPVRKILTKLDAVEVREIKMKNGNKISRILAWRF